MLSKTLVVLLIGLAACNGFPTPDDQYQNIKDNLRALANRVSSYALDTMSNAGNPASARLNPSSRERRAVENPSNLASELRNLGSQLQADSQNLAEKVLIEGKPVQADRSAFIGTSDALSMIQNKYLTEDGKDLLRTVFSFSQA